MKPSFYNVTCPLGDGKYVLYNTYWQSLAVLDEGEKAAYDALCDGCSETGMLAEKLEELHFLVDDPEAEADWLKYEYEKYKYNSRLFELIITPTINCNYRCPYCYERKRPGRMSVETQDALIAFVKNAYDDQAFEDMRVTWYGGEPLLEVAIIERLSKAFLRFCEEQGIHYHAALMTNGSLADEQTMERIYACGVKSVQVTFGGKGEVHDAERPARNGRPTFDAVYENTCRMLEQGTTVHVEYVFDKDNIDSCLEVVRNLSGRSNLYTHFPYPKMDYNNDFTDEKGVSRFNLQNPRERAESYRDIILASRPNASQWEQFLRPLHHYCGCEYDRFFVIDELGNAYKCICDVDKPQTHALFNVNDSFDDGAVNWKMMTYYMVNNPLDSPRCRHCKVFPLCNGYCHIDRDPERYWVPVRCHPIKMVIEDFVTAYYRVLEEEGKTA